MVVFYTLPINLKAIQPKNAFGRVGAWHKPRLISHMWFDYLKKEKKMSLVIIKEPKTQNAGPANGLEPGTWFLDFNRQVSVVVTDDRTFEKRALTIGASNRPFIVNRPVWSIQVNKTLPIGTSLQIAQPGISGEQSNGK